MSKLTNPPADVDLERRVAEKTIELIREADLDPSNMILYAPRVYKDFRDRAREIVAQEVPR